MRFCTAVVQEPADKVWKGFAVGYTTDIITDLSLQRLKEELCDPDKALHAYEPKTRLLQRLVEPAYIIWAP